MWDKIKKLSGLGAGDDPADSAETETIQEARICATALLVEVALADGIYARIEEELIEGLVAQTFKIDAAAAVELVNKAEERAEAAVDHHRFTKVVKTLPLEERQRLVACLWRVVFADGEESPFEDAFVRKIVALLGVSDRDSRVLRQQVRDATGGEGTTT